MDVVDTKAPQREAELEKEEITIAMRLTKLENNVAELTQLFKEKMDRDEAKGKPQLQQYEKDFIFEKFQKRIFLDIIQLFDRIEDVGMYATLSESEDFNAPLESFQTKLIGIQVWHEGWSREFENT